MTKDLTHGPITKTLLLFAIPMILGNLLQQLYNVADTLIVGQFLGPDALAAVGSSYTLMTLLFFFWDRVWAVVLSFPLSKGKRMKRD